MCKFCTSFAFLVRTCEVPHPDDGKDNAHTEHMEKCPEDTSSSFALSSTPMANRLPWNCISVSEQTSASFLFSVFFLVVVFLKRYNHVMEEPGRHQRLHAHKHACWELSLRNAQLGSGQLFI